MERSSHFVRFVLEQPGETFGGLYFKVSMPDRSETKPEANIFNLRVHLGNFPEKTSLGPEGLALSSLPTPVSEESLTLVAGPLAITPGDMEARPDLKDTNGLWVKVPFSKTFEWDGVSSLLVDISYNVQRLGSSKLTGANNIMLRATYGSSRTAVFTPSWKSGRVFTFVPFLMLESSNTLAIKADLGVNFPSTTLTNTLDLKVDVSLNGQDDCFVVKEVKSLVPGANFYLTLSGDSASVNEFNKQSSLEEFKKIVVSALSSSISSLKASNVIISGVGLMAKANLKTSEATAGRSLTASEDITVEIKIVSSDSFQLSAATAAELHTQVTTASSVILADLQNVPSFSGLASLAAALTIGTVAGSATQIGFANNTPSFTLFDTRGISVGSVYPALSSVKGGTEVTISGAGFITTPTTADKKVVIRWALKDTPTVWLTSYGTVNSLGNQIITTTPPADRSLVPKSVGFTTVYVQVSFNGLTFTSISFVSTMIYYLTPKLNSFYVLDATATYPIGNPPFPLSDPGYRMVRSMPQSGKVYDTVLKSDQQLYLYLNSSSLYLSTATTMCIFLNGATGDNSKDDFNNCLIENRSVLDSCPFCQRTALQEASCTNFA